MTDDRELERLRRHVRALATVNRQLHDQLEEALPVRRAALAKEWLDQIRATPVIDEPVLVRRGAQGAWLLEGGRRRAVRSGLLAAALEQSLGVAEDVDDATFEACEEGAPVEVFEGPAGPPFVVVGRRRLPVRGLPLPAPMAAADVLAFPEGPELRLRTAAEATAPGAIPPAQGPSDGPPLPTFVIIGAQKSATRWLRSNLGRHRQVFTPPHEPSFFNHEVNYHEKGVRWYRSQFEGWSGEPLLGESTPGYMMWRHRPDLVAARMHEVLPDARILAILRNPIDRAQSAMVHHQKRGRLPTGVRLVDLVLDVAPEEDQLGLVAGGWYAASLQPFLDRFGDQVLLLLHDDLADDAVGVYRRALEHIGAEPDFVPVELEQVRFSNQPKAKPGDVTPEERRALWPLFEDDVRQLEQMMSRDLSRWAPSVEGSLDGDGDGESDEPETGPHEAGAGATAPDADDGGGAVHDGAQRS